MITYEQAVEHKIVVPLSEAISRAESGFRGAEHEVPQNTPLWFLLRQGRITGSRISSILGLKGSYSRPNDVMEDMIRGVHGVPTRFKGNMATQWGIDNESVAAAAYEASSGELTDTCGIFIHAEHWWLAESPDRLVGDAGLLQVKCRYGKRDDPNPEFKSIADLPADLAQCLLSMECADRDWIDYVQWTPFGMKIERIDRDPKWLQSQMSALSEFYTEFVTNLADEDRVLWFLSDREEVRDDEDWVKTARMWQEVKSVLDNAKQVEADLRKDLIKMSRVTTSKGGGITVRKQERKGNINYKSQDIVAALKDLNLDEYRSKPTSSYTITINKEAS